MIQGVTKQINIIFKFDENNEIIDGSKEDTKDSRFLGVTFFDKYGNKSTADGKSPVIPIPYIKMTQDQKETFDNLIDSYINLKDQK